MRKTTFYLSFIAALFLTACGGETSETTENTEVATEATATEEGEVYQVAQGQSIVTWHGEKVLGKHEGEIKLQSGNVTVDSNNNLTGGEIVMDMRSITNKDLTDQEQNDKLVGHLKSDDFFGVETYPTAIFKITGVTPIADAAAGQPNHEVQGDLTIKDKTERISFPALITVSDNTVNAKADVTVDRSKFDVRFGSETFFGDLGDKAISDEFRLNLDITATK
ncbi:polyisoprenoid-binding protein YceI [Pontibacter aydingkolensis]|uniref:YceI family protein n=1 Tax=Pontibacter aydingkolensis TaxID=1911536 RepID=A0ABS7CYR5_9BACT|nr:YceI family protein [Pontibacter aydingkolensis]MBW7468967.1 YceI family protein [Pontibacter aydingkolensis]